MSRRQFYLPVIVLIVAISITGLLAVLSLFAVPSLAQQEQENQSDTILFVDEFGEVNPSSLTVLTIQPGGNDKLTLTFRNTQNFYADDVPQIAIEDFVSDGENGAIRLLEDDTSYGSRLADWIEGPNALINLGRDDSNILEFHITVPSFFTPGSYGVAITFSSQEHQRLGRHLVIINLGISESESLPLQIVEGSDQIDFSNNLIQITLYNAGNSYLNPSPKLVLTSADGSESYQYIFVQAQSLGIFPGTQQIFRVNSDHAAKAVDLLTTGQQWRSQVMIYCDASHSQQCANPFSLNLPIASLSSTATEISQNDQEVTTAQEKTNETSDNNQETSGSTETNNDNNQGKETKSEDDSGGLWKRYQILWIVLIIAASLIIVSYASIRVLKIFYKRRYKLTPGQLGRPKSSIKATTKTKNKK